MRQPWNVSQKWTVCVGGRTYGPYTAAQMQSFAAEGRLVAYSLVARDPDGPFGPATQDADLAFLFHPARPQAVAQKDSSTAEAQPNFGHGHGPATDEPSHYLIVADMKSGSITALEEEIFRMGTAYPVMPQAWVLASTMPIGALRNLLVQRLGRLDQLFIANASQDKIAWVNLGMETEVRVHRIWSSQPQLSAA